MQKFILLAGRRSGTTLFIDCLNSHPDVFCYKRIFGVEKKIKSPDENRHSSDYFLYRTANLFAIAQYFLSRQASISKFLQTKLDFSNGIKAHGFRVIYSMSNKYPALFKWAGVEKAKVIHLVRENVLKTYISEETAKIHKMHHPKKGDIVSTVKLHINISTIQQTLNNRLHEIEAQRAGCDGLPYLQVTYESFVERRGVESKRVLEFLGVDSDIDLKSDLIKINPSNLEDLVENYQELKSELTGTPLEKLLN